MSGAKLFAAISLLALAGCSGNDDTKRAIMEFGKACNTTVSAKLTLSQWNNALELTCSDVGELASAKGKP